MGKQGTGRRREKYRTEQLPDRRTLERNKSGVSGAADVGGRLWRLCRRGRFGRHEQGRARRGDSPHRAGWGRVAYRFAGVARIPTRLGAQGTLPRSDGSREGTLWGVRPGHRICRHDGSKSAGQSAPTNLEDENNMNAKIAPSDLTQRPPRSFHVRLGELLHDQAAWERYDPIFISM